MQRCCIDPAQFLWSPAIWVRVEPVHQPGEEKVPERLSHNHEMRYNTIEVFQYSEVLFTSVTMCVAVPLVQGRWIPDFRLLEAPIPVPDYGVLRTRFDSNLEPFYRTLVLAMVQCPSLNRKNLEQKNMKLSLIYRGHSGHQEINLCFRDRL